VGWGLAPCVESVCDGEVFSLIRSLPSPLTARRGLLKDRVLPKRTAPTRYRPELKTPLADLAQSAKAQRLEALVAKRCDSRDEHG
jgi:hypothetical protein